MKLYYRLLRRIANFNVPGCSIRATIISILFLVSLTAHAGLARDPYPFQSQEDANTFAELISEIRCVVCQNQNLAESSAPLAKDLRKKIYQMTIAKKSKTEIQNFLTERYGEFILLRPLVNKNNFLLWIFPVLGIMIFIFIVISQQIKVSARS